MARKIRETRQMTSPAPQLEARLWREVSRHLELGESLGTIARLIGERLPATLLLVRRLERDPVRLTTVAAAACDAGSRAAPATTRTELGAREAAKLESWLARGRLTSMPAGEQSLLRRAVVPEGVEEAVIAGPLRGQDGAQGVVLLTIAGETSDRHLEDAQLILEPLTVAFDNDRRLHELARMRAALEADREALLSRLQRQDISEVVIGASGGLRAVMERVELVAPTDAPVLILGETGSGKEVIARAIHEHSRRAGGPIVRVNCGAIPAELIDSELFGHERGSFTGAIAGRKGWFERADGGTLFLDEIGELPAAAQVRLLRVLQDGTLERVGGHQALHVDVRIIAATHRQLETMVGRGTFREDLWYRICVFPIRLPALRQRLEDLPALAAHFAERAGLRLGGTRLVPTAADVELLRSYAWPGNVRELAAVIERAAILGDGRRLEVAAALGTPAEHAEHSREGDVAPSLSVPGPVAASLPAAMSVPAPLAGSSSPGVPTAPAGGESLSAAMAAHIEQALLRTHGRIEGPFGAARVLGINPHTLRARMRKLGIDWARYRGR